MPSAGTVARSKKPQLPADVRVFHKALDAVRLRTAPAGYISRVVVVVVVGSGGALFRFQFEF
jgi:hypothetical protein